MASLSDQPKIYLKRSCPFCLKLRIFMTEAGLAGRVEYVIFDDGDDTHQALRARMEKAGQNPSFPAAELLAGTLTSGTDALIAHFADDSGVAPQSLPLLEYYESGVFPSYLELFKTVRAAQGSQAV